MKKKVIAAVFTKYVDSARVTTNHESPDNAVHVVIK